jgi:hypothetical protein
VHTIIDVVDESPLNNHLSRTKDFSFTPCKSLLWIVTRKNDHVSVIILYLFILDYFIKRSNENYKKCILEMESVEFSYCETN